jgi:ligand-binding SRPBCC domain-containing protein
MAVIILKTQIAAPIEKCFDLSRSIDLHLKSMQHTDERAIDGRTSGLIGFHETVTWKARHFRILFRMTVKITEMKYPDHFTDELVTGPFSKFHHQHRFQSACGKTEMTDRLEFVSPFGLWGRLADWLFLKKYLRKLLLERNKMIRLEAEHALN